MSKLAVAGVEITNMPSAIEPPARRTGSTSVGQRSANREQRLHPGRPGEEPAQNARTLRDAVPRDVRGAGVVRGKMPQFQAIIAARPDSADREAHGLLRSSRPFDSRQRMNPDIRP